MIRAALSDVGIGENDIDLEALKGVSSGGWISNINGVGEYPYFVICFSLNKGGEIYTREFNENLKIIFVYVDVDGKGGLMGSFTENKWAARISQYGYRYKGEDDFPLDVIMDHAVSEACDLSWKYTRVDVPKILEEAKELYQQYKDLEEYHARQQEEQGINFGQEHVYARTTKHFENWVSTLTEHLKSIQDPVDIKYENGKFVATLQIKNNSQPGEDD